MQDKDGSAWSVRGVIEIDLCQACGRQISQARVRGGELLVWAPGQIPVKEGKEKK